MQIILDVSPFICHMTLCFLLRHDKKIVMNDMQLDGNVLLPRMALIRMTGLLHHLQKMTMSGRMASTQLNRWLPPIFRSGSGAGRRSTTVAVSACSTNKQSLPGSATMLGCALCILQQSGQAGAPAFPTDCARPPLTGLHENTETTRTPDP